MSDLYTFTVDGFSPEHFKVHVFTGRETISDTYAFDIVVTSDGTDEEVERLALGQRAVLSWNIGGTAPRAFYGILAAVQLEEIHETAPRAGRYHMRLVPRLWLLKRKRRTRIFQQMRVREIVDAVLGEVGIVARWALLRDYPVREYCTQYEESDYRFITRLLAESGIYFFFPQGPLDESGTAASDALIPGDSILFGDDASGYQPIGKNQRNELAADSSAPPLYFLAMQETKASHADKVTRFGSRTTVRASVATFRDYDPERPMARLVSSATSTQPFPGPDASIVDTAVAAFTSAGMGAAPGLEVYEHHGPFLFPKWSFAKDEAALILRQKRRRASVASGDSGCPDLAPGHRFSLENHPAGHLNREYVVTTVEHRGEARPQGGTEWRTYRNTFSCAPAEIATIPPRPKRRSVQVSLTAIVVGPPGEEIHVDAMGQIKVQFHWDRNGVYDDRSSCWIRTMHAWGGAGWGAQFIPRVGMEVIVVFEGGDTDKPLILGSVYNGTHPPPFALPMDKTRSGWRTQSSPGGNGFNELSFQDAATREQIYVRAQRNLDEVVERNHTLLVKNDEFLRVLGGRLDTIEKHLEANTRGDSTSFVHGNNLDVVTGNSDERISGMLATRVEGKEHRNVTGTTDLEYADDLTTRVRGCITTIVGKHDKKRSWLMHAEGSATLSSLDATEVISDGEIVLRVGESSIRITSDRIELASPTVSTRGAAGGLAISQDALALSSNVDARLVVKQKLVLRTEGKASLSMEKEIKLDGSQILLNSPAKAKDPPPKEPDPPTKVELKDEEGNPLPQQRFLVTLADETETGGLTDDDGTAELELEAGGNIVFPDLTVTDDIGSTRSMRPYVIRQGDYMTKLAGVFSFDVDEVWNHSKNDDIRSLRQDHNILAAGDIVFLPATRKTGQPISKGTTNTYVAKVPKVAVELKLRYAGVPVANEAYEVQGLVGVPPGTTDSNGTILLSLPTSVREVHVRVPEQGLSFRVAVGHMDPIGEDSGIRARLENLRILARRAPNSEDNSDLAGAIARFQKQAGLPETGEVDAMTRDALAQEHGS